MASLSTPKDPDQAQRVKAEFEQRILTFVNSELTMSMDFADLARSLADRGDVEGAARNIWKARQIYEAAEELLRILTGISAEERTLIENRMGAIARTMETLSR